MNQLSLALPKPIPPVDWKTVVAVGASIQEGLSRATYMRADDSTEYIAKGIGFGADRTPYGPANELIAALLGRELGIPMNDCALLSHNGSLLFGSQWMNNGTFGYCDTDEKLLSCSNSNSIYDILVFDLLLCNTDRHVRNLMIRYYRQAHRPAALMLLANDHDRCLMPLNVTPLDLREYWRPYSPKIFIKHPVLRRAIVDPAKLDRAIAAVEALGDDSIAATLRAVPDALLARPDRRLVRQFLLTRRFELRAIVRDLAGEFPNLQGAVP